MLTVPQSSITRTDGRADRQTGGQLTIAIPRFALRASRGEKVPERMGTAFLLLKYLAR